MLSRQAVRNEELARHTNDIVLWLTEKQFLLKRLADATMDIYGMVAVLSR